MTCKRSLVRVQCRPPASSPPISSLPRIRLPSDPELLACADAAEWESWLAHHHDQSTGIWLLIAKKGSGKASVTISDALDVALCYGWIDSQRKGHDATSYRQRYSPRRSGSPWSRLNVERVEALTDAGRMRAPGLAEVDAAKADGRWAAAYEPQRVAVIPSDLASALEENERAQRAFEQLDKGGRYAVFLPILKASNPAMRATRVQKAIAELGARRGTTDEVARPSRSQRARTKEKA